MKIFHWLMVLVTATAFVSGCGNSSNNDSDSAPATDLVINEFKANIPEDIHALQYIELRGSADRTITDTYLVVLDGDEGDVGVVDYALNLDGVRIGSNGLIMIKNADEYNDVVSAETTLINEPLLKTYIDDDDHEDGLLEHDAVSYVLLKTSAEIHIGDDLDSNDDGTIDLTGATIIDAVGSLNGDEGVVYGSVILSQSASDPDAATRFYDDMTANSLAAWANGDIYEDPAKSDAEMAAELRYDTLEASANLPPNAKLTPGGHNFRQAPFVILNELVNSGDKYVELLSNASQNLDSIYLVAIDNSEGTATVSIDLSGHSAGEAGITFIYNNGYPTSGIIGSAATALGADLSGLTSNDSSVLLIYSPQADIVAGTDLDSDNDGTVDLDAAAVVLDNFGWGNSSYSAIKADNSSYTIEAASRYKDNRMASLAVWTYGSLTSLEYDSSASKNSPAGAYVTPAAINIAAETAIIVTPILETERSTISDPDADDVAIWIHPDDPSKSFVIGTQKNAGYSIYDVNGNTLTDALPEENRYNNVDVIYNFNLNGANIDIALFTDRNNNKFGIYRIQEAAPYIVDITDDNSPQLFEAQEPGEDTAYGEGVYKSPVDGKVYAFATQNGTWNAAQFELVANADGTIGWNKVRSITLEAGDDDEHAEGIVVDQEYGKAYIAQEGVGVYTIDAEPSSTAASVALTAADMIAEEGEDNLVADLEGMTIYYKDNGEGYVFLSSQGNITYAAFARTANGVANSYLASFVIADDMNGIDGTQHTDSIDVTNIAISDLFPYGAFIAQDGTDTTGDADDVGTNFKWMRWDDIAERLGDVSFSSNYDPRSPLNRRL